MTIGIVLRWKMCYVKSQLAPDQRTVRAAKFYESSQRVLKYDILDSTSLSLVLYSQESAAIPRVLKAFLVAS